VTLVALPVLERLPALGNGRVLGAVSRATYVDVDGFVVAITPPETPRLPNAVSGPPDGPVETWDPTLRRPGRKRGRWLMSAFALEPADLFSDEEGSDGVRHVLASIATGDPAAAREGLRLLIGRGRGLTPEGDDFVAGAVAVVAAAGRPHPLLDALGALRVRMRTTALSATLLELAAAAQVPEPLQRAFSWNAREGMFDLLRLGHTTGRAYATGAAAAAASLPE